MLTAGLGIQFATLCIVGIVMTPTVMITVAGGSDAYLSWAVFSAIDPPRRYEFIKARRAEGPASGRVPSGGSLPSGHTTG